MSITADDQISRTARYVVNRLAKECNLTMSMPLYMYTQKLLEMIDTEIEEGRQVEEWLKLNGEGNEL